MARVLFQILQIFLAQKQAYRVTAEGGKVCNRKLANRKVIWRKVNGVCMTILIAS